LVGGGVDEVLIQVDEVGIPPILAAPAGFGIVDSLEQIDHQVRHRVTSYFSRQASSPRQVGGALAGPHWHAPATQVGVAGGHTRPQPPQLGGLVCVFSSPPFVGFASQSPPPPFPPIPPPPPL